MKKWATCMMAAGFLLATPVVKAADKMTKEQKAQQKAEQQKDKIEFQNVSIDARATHAQQMYQKQVDQINKLFSERQTFEGAQKDARLSYEKQRLDDHLAFLNSLKSMKGADRKPAWEKFDADEKTKREQFWNDQKTKREQFRQQEESERQQFEQSMKAENDQFRTQLREKGVKS